MSEIISTRDSAPRSFRGGCDCGAVLYEVELDLRAAPEASSVWERRVRPASFRLLAGHESVTGYEFFADSVHFFCQRCGVRAFSHYASDPSGAVYSIDLKCLHGARAIEPPLPTETFGLCSRRPS